MILECFEYNQHFVAMMNVINAARLNPPAQGQKHHIIPRCWFKKNYIKIDNSKNNLVLLSLEDHIKVHRLASLCVKDEYIKSAMMAAANFIAHEGICDTKGKFNTFYGKHHSLHSKNKISESKKGKLPINYGVPCSNFGKKFKEHFNKTHKDDPILYTNEYNLYMKYGKCSWER